MSPKICLTNHQKAQLRHLQAVFHEQQQNRDAKQNKNCHCNDGSNNNNNDESRGERHQPFEIWINEEIDDRNEEFKDRRQSTKGDEDFKKSHVVMGGCSSCNGSSNGSNGHEPPAPLPLSKRRRGLLAQMDLAIEIRQQLEACLQQPSISPEQARDYLVETKHAQLRLMALTEAVQSGYLLDNYDYFIDQYEQIANNRTLACAVQALKKGKSLEGSNISPLRKTTTNGATQDHEHEKQQMMHFSLPSMNLGVKSDNLEFGPVAVAQTKGKRKPGNNADNQEQEVGQVAVGQTTEQGKPDNNADNQEQKVGQVPVAQTKGKRKLEEEEEHHLPITH